MNHSCQAWHLPCMAVARNGSKYLIIVAVPTSGIAQWELALWKRRSTASDYNCTTPSVLPYACVTHVDIFLANIEYNGGETSLSKRLTDRSRCLSYFDLESQGGEKHPIIVHSERTMGLQRRNARCYGGASHKLEGQCMYSIRTSGSMNCIVQGMQIDIGCQKIA